MRAAVNDRARELAEDRLLDLLLPAPAGGPAGTAAEEASGTREKLRQKLRSGGMDERTVELELAADSNPLLQVVGPVNMEDMGANLQEMLGGLLPRRTRRRKTTVREARVLLANEEASKLIDQEAAVRAAIHRVENSGIVFLDEIDKIAGSRGQAGGPDVSREGVQRDLLPIVEGSGVSTKYGPVRTDHVLFIASGAFHVSKPSDLIPELQGRFPIRVELRTLTRDDFVQILTQPENALIKQYAALLATEGVTVEFRQDGIEEIAAIAAEVNDQVENIGARRLHTVMTTLLEDVLFESPDGNGPSTVVVDRAMVSGRLASIVRNRDLSRYIL
jgi:ATP-dependent HslUV protease ATP-binding subunit HslU